MLAVAIAVIRQHGKKEPAFATGWIELVEWAVLAAFDAVLRNPDEAVAEAALQIWSQWYVIPLEEFYSKHAADLAAEDSLALHTDMGFEAAAQSYLAFWHLARLGILWQSMAMLPVAKDAPERAIFEKGLNEIGDRIVGLCNGNTGALRPVMDSHHIELFLVWSVLYGLGRADDMAQWLQALTQRLVVRRREGGPLRLLSTENTWESVFETIAEGNPLTKAYGRSSYLYQMLEEMTFGFPPKVRDLHLRSIHECLVLGVNAKGKSLDYKEEVELVSWAPPAGWEKLMLTGELENRKDNGVAITTGNFVRWPDDKDLPLAERVQEFVRQTRERYPLKRETNLPLPVLLLAAVKFRTPVPPEFWRAAIFAPAPAPPPQPPPETT
jgi:hypothetical protein